MATLQLNNVISGASKVINSTLNNNKPVARQTAKLTPKQQVDLFLKMPDGNLEAIRVKRGEVEYQRYINRMLELSKEYYAKQ